MGAVSRTGVLKVGKVLQVWEKGETVRPDWLVEASH